MSYASLLIHKCTRIRRTPIDKWGNYAETATPDIACRIEHGTRMVRDFKGEEVLSSARIFFLSSEDLEPTDRLRFQDGNDTRNHGILRIERQSDSANLHHIEVSVD